MRKIFIVGIVASGKTTLAKQLSKDLNITWYELDSVVYHKTEAGRYKRTAEEQVQVIQDIDSQGAWIMEGVDRDSYRCLYEMADTIIFLDPPLWKRRLRISTRFVKQRLGIEKCHYKPNLTMLKNMYKWTRDFEQSRAGFEERLKLHNDKVIRLMDNRKLDIDVSSDFNQIKRRLLRRNVWLLTLSLLIVIGITVLSLIQFGSKVMSSACGNKIIRNLNQPDGGHFTAVYYERDCGATTGFSYHLSVIEQSSELANVTGNVYISDSEFQISWHDSINLSIQGSSGDKFKKMANMNGIIIKYE
ncbi:hypothetical protein NV379_17670 [Paenibacillus sp. N1-5-1-14]|uniref:hypothetical protein n=1 Tax=Paenibacillus radicibacter TaxID=2972488 RepID=UPI0021591FF4|nr:hypothetical protein [Paenibacillus radicibacter]MCR8644487.1 hypothetical protein [Paenibacillus radicibacter]